MAGDSLAQTDKGRASKPGMSEGERQRMREQMEDVYRSRGERADRPERPPQMSAEERESLRRDIQDANKDLRRKKRD